MALRGQNYLTGTDRRPFYSGNPPMFMSELTKHMNLEQQGFCRHGDENFQNTS